MSQRYRCNECGSYDIHIEAIVKQDFMTGELEVVAACDKNHMCDNCSSKDIKTVTVDMSLFKPPAPVTQEDFEAKAQTLLCNYCPEKGHAYFSDDGDFSHYYCLYCGNVIDHEDNRI